MTVLEVAFQVISLSVSEHLWCWREEAKSLFYGDGELLLSINNCDMMPPRWGSDGFFSRF